MLIEVLTADLNSLHDDRAMKVNGVAVDGRVFLTIYEKPGQRARHTSAERQLTEYA